MTDDKTAELTRLEERITEKRKLLEHISKKTTDIKNRQDHLSILMNNYETAINIAIKTINES